MYSSLHVIMSPGYMCPGVTVPILLPGASRLNWTNSTAPSYRMRKCAALTSSATFVAVFTTVAMVISTRLPSDRYACLTRSSPLQTFVSRPVWTSLTTAMRRQNDDEPETPCMTSRSRGDDDVIEVKSYRVRLMRRPASASISHLK